MAVPVRTPRGTAVNATDVKDPIMDEDRRKGVGKQVSGSIKEAVGKVTGDTKTQAEGTAEKAAGKAQNAVGGTKDAVRNAADK